MLDGAQGCVTANGTAGYNGTKAAGVYECVEDARMERRVGSATFREGLYYPCGPLNGLAVDRCLGPADRSGFDAQCMEGHTGPVCGRCQAGYHKAFDSWVGAHCVPCYTGARLAQWYAARGLAGPEIDWNAQPLDWTLHFAGAGIACALLVAVLLCVLRKTDDLMYDDHPLYNSVKEERERQLSVGVQSPGGTLRDPTTGAAVPSLARSASAEERFRKRAYNVGEKLMQCFALRNLRNMLASLPSLGGTGAVIISHLQIVALLPSQIDIEWPPALVDLADTLKSWVAFDPTLLNMDCLNPQTYFDRLFGALFTALVLLAAVPALYAVVALLHKCGLPRCCGKPLTTFRLLRWRARCSALYLVLVFVLYAPIASIVVRYFVCREYGDGAYLVADVGIKCWDADGTWAPTYRAWLPTAVFGVVVVVVALPAVNFGILYYNHRRHALDTKYCRSAYGILYSKFTEDNRFWELLDTLKRLLFTCVLSLLEGRLAIQCVLGLLIAFAIVVVHANRRPYANRSEDRIALANHTAVFLLMLTALQVQAGYVPDANLSLSLALLPVLLLALIVAWVLAEHFYLKVVAKVLRKIRGGKQGEPEATAGLRTVNLDAVGLDQIPEAVRREAEARGRVQEGEGSIEGNSRRVSADL